MLYISSDDFGLFYCYKVHGPMSARYNCYVMQLRAAVLASVLVI